jgi:hypothetical protein
MSDVTRLLDAAAAGDRKAATDLLPLVYDELRMLAAAPMAAEVPGHTLNATALVPRGSKADYFWLESYSRDAPAHSTPG